MERYPAYSVVKLLLMSLSMLSIPAIGHSCNLSGKVISVDVVLCPDFKSQIDSSCRRSRQRFSIHGDKVLEYMDEITPEGIIFYIGKNNEVTNDEEQMRFFQLPKEELSPVDRQADAKMYKRAWVTASYSAGQLRLKTERKKYFRNDNSLFSSDFWAYVFDIRSDCSACELAHAAWAVNIAGARIASNILRQQTCLIRSGS